MNFLRIALAGVALVAALQTGVRADAAEIRVLSSGSLKAALSRLETLLALVEGWVATVVSAAATGRLPQADALAEAIRRRRATGVR